MNPENQVPQGASTPTETPTEAQSSAGSYDFITNTNHRPKKASAPMRGGSLRSRILKIAGGGLVLIILVVVISRFAFGSSANNGVLLTALVAQQQEVVRIATLGVADAKDPVVINFAQTTKTVVSSQESELLSYLKSKNVKYTTAQLSAEKNTETDKILAQAVASNQYDSVFTETLKASLLTYTKDIKKNHDSASNAKSKTILADSYNSVATLLK